MPSCAGVAARGLPACHWGYRPSPCALPGHQVSTTFPLTDAARARPGAAAMISVAIHEIGHACIANQLGLRVESVEIHADASGQCFFRPGPEEDLIAATMAGEAAEIEFGIRDVGVVADCADPDRFRALAYARRLEPADPDRALRRGAAVARSVLQRYWSPVERLAEILLEQRLIAGEELRTLLDAAVGGADDIRVAAAAAIDHDRQAETAFEVMVGRRLAFERLIREQPGVDQRFAWTAADEQARRAWAEADREAATRYGAEPRFAGDRGERLRLLIAATGGPG
jgi:hypothetical protein